MQKDLFSMKHAVIARAVIKAHLLCIDAAMSDVRFYEQIIKILQISLIVICYIKVLFFWNKVN